MENTVEVGQFVESHYNRRWVGVILAVEKRKDNSPLILCLIVETSDGNTPRKRILKQIDSAWMAKDIKPFDISHINKDWFDITTSGFKNWI